MGEEFADYLRFSFYETSWKPLGLRWAEGKHRDHAITSISLAAQAQVALLPLC
jgi:hypothetical protein